MSLPESHLTLSKTATASSEPTGLCLESLDPVCLEFQSVAPSVVVPLRHKTFCEARMYRTDNRGAIVMCTPGKRVLAMDYSDAAELDYHWRETLRHYAGVI